MYCLRDSSRGLVQVIQKGFEHDGLGDLFERVKPGKAGDAGLGERKRQLQAANRRPRDGGELARRLRSGKF